MDCVFTVVFEFVAEGLTTWRYEFAPLTDGDGDAIPLGPNTFTVAVLDDIPVVTSSHLRVET